MIQVTLALLFFQSPVGASFELENTTNVVAGTIQQAADGSLLMAVEARLFHWDSQGRLLNTIHLNFPKKKVWLTCFYYDAAARRYWLIETHYAQSAFYDENGELLGKAYALDGNGKKIPALFRQLLPTRNRLFGSAGTINIWQNPNAKLISEIQIERDDEGDFLIKKVGQPFCPLTKAQTQLDYNFKLHWLVEDPYHNNLYISDQVTSRIRHFAPNSSLEDSIYVLQKKQIPYALPGFKKPPESWNRTIRSKEEYTTWYNSWSRVNGFYRLGDGYLVGYDIPHPEKKGESQKALQKIAQNGKNVGKALIIEGWLAGVFENRVHVVDKSKKNPGQLVLHVFEM